MTRLEPLSTPTLPRGIRSRFVDGINGLTVHILEAGFESGAGPACLLLHGFPELAYSWRKVMLPLAEAGFHVVAPDQRGYGRTTGWDGDYDGDLGPSACSTWCGMRWGSSPRSAIAPSRPSSGTISARRSRRGARWCGPTCSARW